MPPGVAKRWRDSPTSGIRRGPSGHCKDLNSRRGLDHGDGSDDLRYVSGVVWGPGFAKGRVVKDDVRTIDAMYSACDALGASPALAKSQKLKRLLA